MGDPEPQLVDGWALDRLAAAAGVPELGLLDPSAHHVVVVDRSAGDHSYDYTELNRRPRGVNRNRE